MPVLQEIRDHHAPIKVWSTDVDPLARQQLVQTACLPFIFKWLAVMPDVHAGKGSTIGSVIATRGAIVPACVGVDLGCGMSAVRTTVSPAQLSDVLPKLRSRIEGAVPTGMSSHKSDDKLDTLSPADRSLLVDGAREIELRCQHEGTGSKVLKGLGKFPTQLGTLGGGNHFIEICVSERNEVWVMLHSGSRGVGNLIAQHHIETARDEMKRLFVSLPDPDLSYLVAGTPQYEAYIHDMSWAQEFARLNRKVMLASVLDALGHFIPFETGEVIDCHHNYVAHEVHYGEEVLVTRKGAVRARTGDLGIIPGSMGTRSYIVRGKGNAESFTSCSHGAGRRMSRNEARRRFTESDLAAQTAGVECRKDQTVVDEIPAAYKSIDEVMANQSDLVEAVEVLKQVLCVKGA